MTAYEKLKQYAERVGMLEQDVEYITLLLKEAQRDQRHGCAEAINAVEGKNHVFGSKICIDKNVAYQTVFNAKAI